MAASKLQMLGDPTAKCTQHGRLDRTQTSQLTAPAVPERERSVPAPVSAPKGKQPNFKPPSESHGRLSAAVSSARLIRLPVCV